MTQLSLFEYSKFRNSVIWRVISIMPRESINKRVYGEDK